jgi:hypothetical protein
MVPPYCGDIAVREIANALRRTILELGPPTLIAAKFPGLQCATNSPTLIKIWWYCPTFLFPTTLANIWAALRLIPAIG